MSGEKRTKILEAGGFLTNEKDRDGKIGGEHSQNIDRGHRHREEGAFGRGMWIAETSPSANHSGGESLVLCAEICKAKGDRRPTAVLQISRNHAIL